MAATFTLMLGSVDLSGYLRVNPDDKMDPAGAPWIEPAFSETPFSDGQVLISTTVNNREQMWPLFLKDPTYLKDQLHALVQLINNAAAQRPLLLQWKDDGASASTFFDVSFVRFEPDYNFRRSQHGYAGGILHVWTSGYGHTGTTRVTATAAGTGIFLSVPIGSVAGDAPALLDTTITAGAVLPPLGRIVALAPITQPSYTPRIGAASLTDLQPGATVIGASGADGSQYLALPVSPTGGASGVACKVPLPNPTIAGGDNRILAVVKSGISVGVGINALDPYGNAMGATAVASMSQGFGVVDLGVCRLPTVGYPTQPKIAILAGALYASGALGPGILASPAGLAINEVFCLPDKNLTLILEKAAGVLSLDGFGGGNGAVAGRNDNLGNPWSAGWNNKNASAAALFEGNGVSLAYNSLSGTGVPDSAHLAGILTDSMVIKAKPQWVFSAGGASGAAPSGGEVTLAKEAASGVYTQARLQVNASGGFLALAAATNTTLNLLASLAVPTTLMGAQYRLSVQFQGGLAFANLSRDDGGPVFAPASMTQASLGVTSAAVAGAGVPALAVMGAVSVGFAGPWVFSWEVDPIPLPGGITPLSAFDSYRIDGPNADSYRTSSAGVFAGQKLVGQQRGAFAKMAPSTTSLAVVCAPFDQGAANDLISARVSIKERFTYGA
jgi:hypothetical protein